ARRLVERLGPDVSVFFAPERQQELVSTDGVETFTAVYKNDSLTVAILYREDWGSTLWTAVEERAIRERGFQQRAFEFVTLIPLDKGKTPEWFPSTQIYLDWDRLKDDGAVATLRERIIRAGGHAPEESIAARSARLQRAQVRENERVAFLGSSVGR